MEDLYGNERCGRAASQPQFAPCLESILTGLCLSWRCEYYPSPSKASSISKTGRLCGSMQEWPGRRVFVMAWFVGKAMLEMLEMTWAAFFRAMYVLCALQKESSD
jgi:hypothetical protein